jgi:hypothetical protein
MTISSKVDLIEYVLTKNDVFIDNKYFKTYINLISKALLPGRHKKTCETYIERHHSPEGKLAYFKPDEQPAGWKLGYGKKLTGEKK